MAKEPTFSYVQVHDFLKIILIITFLITNLNKIEVFIKASLTQTPAFQLYIILILTLAFNYLYFNVSKIDRLRCEFKLGMYKQTYL